VAFLRLGVSIFGLIYCKLPYFVWKLLVQIKKVVIFFVDSRVGVLIICLIARIREFTAWVGGISSNSKYNFHYGKYSQSITSSGSKTREARPQLLVYIYSDKFDGI
jgi:hypothetical protein